jgi:hypothetical protein
MRVAFESGAEADHCCDRQPCGVRLSGPRVGPADRFGPRPLAPPIRCPRRSTDLLDPSSRTGRVSLIRGLPAAIPSCGQDSGYPCAHNRWSPGRRGRKLAHGATANAPLTLGRPLWPATRPRLLICASHPYAPALPSAMDSRMKEPLWISLALARCRDRRWRLAIVRRCLITRAGVPRSACSPEQRHGFTGNMTSAQSGTSHHHGHSNAAWNPLPHVTSPYEGGRRCRPAPGRLRTDGRRAVHRRATRKREGASPTTGKARPTSFISGGSSWIAWSPGLRRL